MLGTKHNALSATNVTTTETPVLYERGNCEDFREETTKASCALRGQSFRNTLTFDGTKNVADDYFEEGGSAILTHTTWDT